METTATTPQSVSASIIAMRQRIDAGKRNSGAAFSSLRDSQTPPSNLIPDDLPGHSLAVANADPGDTPSPAGLPTINNGSRQK